MLGWRVPPVRSRDRSGRAITQARGGESRSVRGLLRNQRFRVCALGLAVVAALTAAILAASARGSPIPARGVERGDTRAVIFLVSLASAFGIYVAALVVLRSRGGGLALVCALAVAIQLAPLGGPLLLSRDAYSYWAYGRIVSTHDANPFTTAPARFPHDPATRAVASAWRPRVSVYGPAFAFASAGLGDVAKRSAELASLLFRTAAAAAGVGATLLAAAIARRKAYAAAFVGWNPLVAISFAGGGHNDAWMLVLMLASLALVARRRDAAGGAVWILAAAVKAPAIAILALQLVRSRRGVWTGAALAALALAGVATAAFGTAWMTSVVQLDQRQSRYGLPARLEQLAVPTSAARTLAYAALAAGALWLVREARRGRPRPALGASLLLLTSPWILPWYSTWAIGLAAVADDGAAEILALALAVYLLPDRVPL
jgi:Glycosyltransferase family 87